jgi:tetratricopeptide (TPR) repeat protein
VDALRGAAALSEPGAPALKNLLKLQDAGDRSPEVLFNSGLLHQQAGQWQEAIACYREALAANPKFADALVNLGHALMGTGDAEGATQSWAAAVEMNPQLARGYY